MPRGLLLATRVAVAVALVSLLLVVLTHPGRVAAKTLLLLPDMFPNSPLRPLAWVTGPPRVEEYNYDFSVGHVDSDVYLPAAGGRHGALILLLGAVGFPRRDPALVRFADGLSRAGAVVLIPESSNLQQGDILPGEVDGLLQAVTYLRARPEVDPERVGFLGFSVGGSLAILAAEDERGRDQIGFVNAFGSYYDARDLLRAVATRQIRVDGQMVPWAPSELTVWVFSRQLIQPLPDERDRDILARVLLDKEPQALADLGNLSADGRLVLELFLEPKPERVDAIIADLPPALRERLAGISPSRGLEHLAAHLYLMHDRSDSYIPFTESRKLTAAAPPGTFRAYGEFDLFAHVMPDRPLPGPVFALELLKLYHHAWLFCQEFL
jgi:acetyl esterase/lipase